MQRCLLVGLIFVLLAVPSVLAQDAPQYVNVFTAHTELGHQAEYEAGIKSLWAAMKKAGGDFPILASVSMSSPGDYNFVTLLPNMAAMDAQNEMFNKAFAAAGPVLAELGKYSKGNTTRIVATRPDLSYQPENPRVAGDGPTYARVTWLHAKPGHQQDLAGVIGEFAALSKKMGIADGFSVYQNVTGEGPVFLVRTLAKSEADYHSQAEKNASKMGAEGEALRAKAGPFIERIEFTASLSRPDLSYQP